MNMIPSGVSWVAQLVRKLTARARPEEDDWTRWIVESETTPGKEYLVDLMDYELQGDRNGSCTCEEFTFKKQKHLNSGANKGLPLQCKHITKVRDLLVGAMLTREHQRRTKEE